VTVVGVFVRFSCFIHIGYVAQEVQENYPDQVKEYKMLSINYIEVLVAKFKN
jgi:hypothetical protein